MQPELKTIGIEGVVPNNLFLSPLLQLSDSYTYTIYFVLFHWVFHHNWSIFYLVYLWLRDSWKLEDKDRFGLYPIKCKEVPQGFLGQPSGKSQGKNGQQEV